MLYANFLDKSMIFSIQAHNMIAKPEQMLALPNAVKLHDIGGFPCDINHRTWAPTASGMAIQSNFP
jgi:hypothetical protein